MKGASPTRGLLDKTKTCHCGRRYVHKPWDHEIEQNNCKSCASKIREAEADKLAEEREDHGI